VAARGDRAAPLSDAEMLAKFDLLAAALGREEASVMGVGCLQLAEPGRPALAWASLFSGI